LKIFPLVCLISIVFNSSIAAQPIQRFKGQSSDSLVHTILPKKFNGGNAYEFRNGNNSFIIYSELTNKKKQIEEFYATSTLLNLLHSDDDLNFTNYFIDTLSTGNSCWAPAQLDSIFLINIDNDVEKEICVVLNHIPYCDAYLNYVSVHFYDNLENFILYKKLKPLRDFTFAIHEFSRPVNEIMEEKINSFLKEKPEIKK
jgi:hypothetical protein